jgi:hypothetical protein
LRTAATGFEPQFPARPLNAFASLDSRLIFANPSSFAHHYWFVWGCEALLHESKQVLAALQLDGAAAIAILKGVA